MTKQLKNDRFALNVNGRTVSVETHRDTPLLCVLRNDLGLNGPRSGCDAAQCGACTVLCNGREIPSCTTSIAAADGCEIVTSEGLGTTPQTRSLQAAFFEEQASQCGFCIPGMMIGATALLAQNPAPNKGQIKVALERHICRCGTHPRIVAAIERAVRDIERLGRLGLAGVVASEEALVAGNAVHEDTPRPTRPGAVESWVTIGRDGEVKVYCGKMDAGTGVRTAFAQLVADELDVAIESVAVILGDTGLTPDQGKSTASAGVALGGQPLKIAARETRAALIARAAKQLNIEPSELDAQEGVVFVKADPKKRISYGELVGNSPIEVELDVIDGGPFGPALKGEADLKRHEDYRYVGKSVRRAAIADHITGDFEYVHNVRMPGMLHGRVVRPPAYSAQLISIDESSVKDIPGVEIVRRNNFVGVVAAREEHAMWAALRLGVRWSTTETLHDERTQFEALRQAERIEEQTNFSEGDAAGALGMSGGKLCAHYHMAPQLHAMLGPSCAVADVRADGATIWSGGQWVQGERNDIAKMLGLPVEQVRVVWREAAGSYGRLGVDDAAADAAYMSQIVGKPVRVQWSRQDENTWEPVSPAATISIDGALGPDGRVHAFDYRQWSSSHATAERGNHVAWCLVGGNPGYDRLTGNIYFLPYVIANKRGRSVFVQPTFRTVYLRGPGGFQSHFATESFMDELAYKAGADPIAFRLQHLEERDAAVLKAVERLSNWKPRRSATRIQGQERFRHGRGVAFARYGMRHTIVAMVAEVAVDRETGRVAVPKVFVAQDCGLMVNPDGVLNQVQGNVVHAVSRCLFEELHYGRMLAACPTWASYPVMRFPDIPEIEVDLLHRPDQPASVVGEIATMPTAGAVANAIFDATGKRVRVAPFTPARVRDAASVLDA